MLGIGCLKWGKKIPSNDNRISWIDRDSLHLPPFQAVPFVITVMVLLKLQRQSTARPFAQETLAIRDDRIFYRKRHSVRKRIVDVEVYLRRKFHFSYIALGAITHSYVTDFEEKKTTNNRQKYNGWVPQFSAAKLCFRVTGYVKR